MEYQPCLATIQKEEWRVEVFGERLVEPEPEYFAYGEWKLYSGYAVYSIEALFYAHLYL